MITDKTIALIAHDARKADMIDWVIYNSETLVKNKLICTGTTGTLVENALKEEKTVPDITKMKSGPMGGDAQIATLVVEGKIDRDWMQRTITREPGEGITARGAREPRLSLVY